MKYVSLGPFSCDYSPLLPVASISVLHCIILISAYKHSRPLHLLHYASVHLHSSTSWRSCLYILTLLSLLTSFPKPTPVYYPYLAAERTPALVTSYTHTVEANNQFSVVTVVTFPAEFGTEDHAIPLDSIPFFRFHGATLSWALTYYTSKMFLLYLPFLSL